MARKKSQKKKKNNKVDKERLVRTYAIFAAISFLFLSLAFGIFAFEVKVGFGL